MISVECFFLYFLTICISSFKIVYSGPLLIFTEMYIYIHVYIYVYIYVYIRIYTRIYICIYTHTYLYTYICIYTHTHTHIDTYIMKCYWTLKKEILSFETMWMHLGYIVLSEINQVQKDKYWIISHMWNLKESNS
jgi:hypothetical protein